MSDRQTSAQGTGSHPLGWVAWVIAAGLFAGGETLAVLNRTRGDLPWSDSGWMFVLLAFGFATVGALVLSQHPRHAIGWLLYVVGLFFEISFASQEYGVYTLDTDPGALPFGRVVATLAWIGGTAFFVMTTQLLLLFPDGRPISPRLNGLVWVGLGTSAVASLSEWLRPGPLDRPVEEFTNPLGVPEARDFLEVASAAGLAGVAICGFIGVATLVIRFRRAEGIQREQLKWITFSAVFFITAWLVQLIGAATDTIGQAARQTLVGVGVSTIPLAAGVAVLRYRLYDIDWIINRTLVYIPLTAILAGVYIAMTGVMRAILVEGPGSDATVALTTVIVVAMLTPVKNYLQERVDRRFKESHDPAAELRKVAREARAAVQVLDPDRYVDGLLTKAAAALDAPPLQLTREDPSGSSARESIEPGTLVVPLLADGARVGTLHVRPRNHGLAYTTAEVDAVRETADVIAYLFALRRNSRPAPETADSRAR